MSSYSRYSWYLNISDDILIYGSNQTDHDEALAAVVKRLDDHNLTLNRSKCEFNKAFSQVGYTGVMTNMRGAFLRVKEILFGTHSANVRPWRDFGKSNNVNKVTFLLTDGRWNDGGNPDDQIQFLKTEHVEIFTIGVTNVDQNFLERVATSSDRYFYYNEFKDFRELATHIRGGKVK